MKPKTKSRTLVAQVADAKARGHMRNDLPSPAMVVALAPAAPPVEKLAGSLREAVADELMGLKARVKELESDFLSLAQLLGNQLGEPIKSEAVKIASKRQT